jgi:pimeloyl-ACP methyl ester carboxylesterase
MPQKAVEISGISPRVENVSLDLLAPNPIQYHASRPHPPDVNLSVVPMSSKPAVRKLVLLPGLDGTGTLFTPFIACLPAPFEAIPIAYPTGQPLNYPELSDLVRSRLPDCTPFVLLAESFSTPLAIQIAAAHPSGLEGLILVAGFATNPTYSWVSRVAPLVLPARAHMRLPSILIRRFLLGPGASQSLVDAVKSAVAPLPFEVAVSRLTSIVHCDVRMELAEFAVPVLYVQATRDRVVPPRCLEEIVAVNRETVVARIDGPHLLLQREPRQCAQIVADFIKKLRII